MDQFQSGIAIRQFDPDAPENPGCLTPPGTAAIMETAEEPWQTGLGKATEATEAVTSTLGLTVALLLWQAAHGLRAPPGAGYT